MKTNREQAYLVLSDGHVFAGQRYGASTDSVGELVFTTGCGGYVETLTDPSYFGQIIVQTFPLIGNYGWIPADMESSRCWASGYVTRELCAAPSNFRAEGTVEQFLIDQGVPGVCGVDTRAITKLIREQGVMAAAITADPSFDPSRLADFAISNAVAQVSGQQQTWPAQGGQKYRVALIDYGTKGNIIRELTRRGCQVIELPHDVTAEQVLALAPDGVLLSNGPGDPAENVAAIAVIRTLLGQLPLFGICLGHQLLALAAGGRTVKLKYGHRGANQPARELSRNRVIITCQNHGYAVEGDSVPGARLSFVNANDQTCEGLEYPGKMAFSVQFHPEACSGPWDSEWLFDDFLQLIDEYKGGAAHAAE